MFDRSPLRTFDSSAVSRKYAEAEPLLRFGYEGLKQHEKQIRADVRQLRLKEAVKRLVQICQATGRTEKAAEWKKKLDGLNPFQSH